MATEVRRRQQQTTEWSSSQRFDEKPRGPTGTRNSGSFILRNLPAILGVQVLLLAFIVIDPFKLRIARPPPPAATGEGPNKAFLGIADVEEMSGRVAINGTILVLVCPAGSVRVPAPSQASCLSFLNPGRLYSHRACADAATFTST